MWLFHFPTMEGVGGVSYGYGPSIANLANDKPVKPVKSAFVTYTWVIWSGKRGFIRSDRPLRGQVVGPDQNYFPSPDEVFVNFPATGFVLLLPVTELEVIPLKVEDSEP